MPLEMKKGDLVTVEGRMNPDKPDYLQVFIVDTILDNDGAKCYQLIREEEYDTAQEQKG